MRIDYTHTLGKAEALERLHALGDYLYNRHKISVTWRGDRATFSGRFKKVVKIAGEMAVGDDRITFAGEDPGFAWRGQATRYIRGKLDQYLDPDTPVADLRRS